MSETYRDHVATLIRGLGEGDGMEEAREALRGLIDKIVLMPTPGCGSLAIDLHGALASLLRLATGASALMAAIPGPTARMRKSSAMAEIQDIDMIGELLLVAGTGFGLHRTTGILSRTNTFLKSPTLLPSTFRLLAPSP